VSFVLALLEGGAHSGLSAYVEPGVILLILGINAAVGVVQESNAEAAIEALKSYEPETARVIRNGKNGIVQAAELVPGDVVEVARGDKIPADMRVIALQATSVRCDQVSTLSTSTHTHLPHIQTYMRRKHGEHDDGLDMLNRLNSTVGSQFLSGGVGVAVAELGI
jgi:Ca2+ transporting ATPase